MAHATTALVSSLDGPKITRALEESEQIGPLNQLWPYPYVSVRRVSQHIEYNSGVQIPFPLRVQYGNLSLSLVFYVLIESPDPL